jgi:23S rRNA (adenine2503-C2)-methyltransferase
MPEPAPTLCPLGLTSDEFVARARERRHTRGAAGALEAYRRVFREGLCTFGPAGVHLPPVRRTLREDSPEGEVVKFTQEVPGPAPQGHRARPTPALRPGLETLETESVLIPMIGSTGQRHYTLCVSSQVGCAMGCTFCETAQMGLLRSLTAGEIVGQWFAATHAIGIRPRNIVFMGMGEPMDNFDEVIQAIAVLKDHNGAHVPVSNITVSTVGRVDGIRRMAEKIRESGWHRLGIALSLNAPNDADRSSIMPINRVWNLGDVQRALLEWPKFAGNKICVEYVLIPGVNDTPAHVRDIAAFMEPFREAGSRKPRAILNLIPYNPRRGSPWPAPEESRVEAFLASLIGAGVFAKRRRTKGRGMMGACGQLGSERVRARRLVEVTVSA